MTYTPPNWPPAPGELLVRQGRIGIVVAHPDDECLGAGATLARLVMEGHTVEVLILATGCAREKEDIKATWAKEKQTYAALEVLGIRDIKFGRLPDQMLDTVPLLRINGIIEWWLDMAQPTLLFTHHAGDPNLDHRIVAQAARMATRPTPGQTVREVRSFSVPSSTEWSFQCGPRFEANIFVDVSATLDKKLAALASYVGEMPPYPHPRSPEAIRHAAGYWGSVAGCGCAEAFQLVRALL